MSVEPYTHCCIIQEGDMAGNKHSQEVEAWEIETRAECSY